MILLYILIGLMALIILLSLIAPKSYEVFRKIKIDRPVDDVFSYLRMLKNQDDWSPWALKDPNMAKAYEGIDGTPGFVSKWEGNKEVGSGEQEIKSIIENKRIDSELRFLKPWKSTSDAYMIVTPSGEGTEVKWGFAGKNKFPMNIMLLFMSMDKMIGKDFEQGLERLKIKLEN